MYALHENTRVYEVQMESFFRDLKKCYIFYFIFTNDAYMYKGLINNS
jgi:hypothetical protein